MTETWLPVVGWEGYYEVSDHGRVRGIDRIIEHPTKGPTRRRGRIMALAHCPYYMMVPLHRDGKLFSAKVHRLVLEAFIGPCPVGMICCHNDGDHRNNHLSNLRWDTPSNNNFDTVRHGRHRGAIKTHCKHGHLFSEANTYIKANGTRRCVICTRQAKRRYRQRKAAA